MWKAFRAALKVAKLRMLEKKLQAYTRIRIKAKAKALKTQARYEKVQAELQAYIAE